MARLYCIIYCVELDNRFVNLYFRYSMERYLKLFSMLVVFPLLTLGFTACSDDDDIANYWASIATVNKIGENKYDFTLDNGKKLWVSFPSELKLEKGYDRAMIYYTILSEKKEGYDYSVQLGQFFEVLTKKPIYIADEDAVRQDSIGNDAIKVHSMWEGGGYLNISFGFNVGEKEAHMLNLVSSDPDLSVTDDVVTLEFRHNQKKDPQSYPYDGYVSFDLSPYKVSGRDKVTFEIKWKDFGGTTKSKKIEYEYNSKSESSNSLNINNNDTNLNIY